MKETKKYFLILFSCIALVALGSSSVPSTPIEAQVQGVSSVSGELPIVSDETMPDAALTGKEDAPDVSAKAVLVFDRVSGKVLYEKNASAKLPIASLTKLMTAILVRENFLDDTVVVKFEDTNMPSFRMELAPGEEMSVEDMLSAMLVSSANDATMALARSTGGDVKNFVRIMNSTAKWLGMDQTSFANPVGFDNINHYSSAFDLSRLVEHFLTYPELVDMVGKKSGIAVSVDGIYTHRFSTTNKLLLQKRGVIGLKTGYTSEAKGNLIILVDKIVNNKKVQYYTIILGSDNREEEATKFMDWVEENFTWN